MKSSVRWLLGAVGNIDAGGNPDGMALAVRQ
jgi:hypothetical protein